MARNMDSTVSQPETRTRADWLAPERVPDGERPAHWDLLTEAASLTGRLEARLGAPVEVERLSEHHDGDGALRREVRLYAAGRPLVYAVSHIPSSLLQRLGWVASLGDQPLGSRLFASGEAVREGLTIARLAVDDPLVQRAWQGLDRNPAPLWARRSRLRVGGQAMVIVECFLYGEQG
ncbi:chorismate--pyruvate lyase family protein [Natronospira bacteriovora]|uniref:Chorismate lyase n=1 Tax=Natronospira bacteriovora TaxID=3069753 RepID=A0ABU0W858_9GAMM|nr:chorismate lyase [Natronospira sp. AB-CW4]MDQ2070186.1 chorismate lyase [Natronospira sp. AB-CW4]